MNWSVYLAPDQTAFSAKNITWEMQRICIWPRLSNCWSPNRSLSCAGYKAPEVYSGWNLTAVWALAHHATHIPATNSQLPTCSICRYCKDKRHGSLIRFLVWYQHKHRAHHQVMHWVYQSCTCCAHVSQASLRVSQGPLGMHTPQLCWSGCWHNVAHHCWWIHQMAQA